MPVVKYKRPLNYQQREIMLLQPKRFVNLLKLHLTLFYNVHYKLVFLK